jgi:hypothetical protein
VAASPPMRAACTARSTCANMGSWADTLVSRCSSSSPTAFATAAASFAGKPGRASTSSSRS